MLTSLLLSVCTALQASSVPLSEQKTINSYPTSLTVNSLYDKNIEKKVNVSFDNRFEFNNFIYFYNLNKNILNNVYGSCGYVAIGMYFSYIDTFENDYFVSEKYDVVSNLVSTDFTIPGSYDSPGILDEIDFLDENAISDLVSKKYAIGTPEYYYSYEQEFLNQLENQIDHNTFYGQLLSIAIEKGFIKPIYDGKGDDYLHGLGVNFEIVKTVLQTYLDEYKEQNPDDKGLNNFILKTGKHSGNDYSIIRREIINLLEQNTPVILGVPGHVLVAYYYDSKNDIIYGNNGWKGCNNFCSFTNLDNYYMGEYSDYYYFENVSRKNNYFNNYYFTDKRIFYSPDGDYYYFHFYGKEIINQSYYNNEEEQRKISINNGYSYINIKYLRAGFIENKVLNLSPKRYEPGIAYLEFEFDTTIDFMTVDLSWWSDDERVSAADSKYEIQFFKDGKWITVVNLWDVDISDSISNPTVVDAYFPDVNKIRFYAEAFNPINDRNKGRLSISQIYFCKDYRW